MLNERDSCETIEHISSERRMTEGREREMNSKFYAIYF